MIIAYASANADPINNPTDDPEIDLASASLPASVQIYGDAVDTLNQGASFSWAWSLLDSDAGNVPTLSSTTTQNITVSGISAWHNIRLHLVATNTATSETSETDILLAPTASFVEIRVLSENQGIQKPAKGSRSWHPVLELWADSIEDPNLALNDLNDVTTATGAQIDILVSGNDAVQGGSALHTHEGDHVAQATNTTAGVVQLEEASSAVGAPRVITRERIVFSATTGRTVVANGVMYEEVIAPQDSHPMSPFIFSRSPLVIRAFSVALANCGTTTHAYDFELVTGSASAYVGRSMSSASATLTLTPASAGIPLTGTLDLGAGVSVSAGTVFGVAVMDSPAQGSGGQILTVTIEAEREIV